MPTTYIPSDHHVVRYVPWARLRTDGEGNVLGVLAAAFSLRDGEEYLSATWLEFANEPRPDCVHAAVQAIRNSTLKPKPKSGFAIGLVEAIARACRDHGHKVRFVHEPEDGNDRHVAIRRWPAEAEELFDLLADDVWSEVVLYKDIPQAG